MALTKRSGSLAAVPHWNWRAVFSALSSHFSLLSELGFSAAPAQEGAARAQPPHGVSREMAFTLTAIAMAARVAAMDGKVTEQEFLAFREMFPLTLGEDAKLRQLFALVCAEECDLERCARQVATLYPGRAALLRALLERLAAIAYADGVARPATAAQLLRIAGLWQIDRRDARRVLRRMSRRQQPDPFEVLGVPRRATAEEIRRAYRRLVQRYHPDALPAKLRTPDTLHIASRKLAAVNAAYSAIFPKAALKAA